MRIIESDKNKIITIECTDYASEELIPLLETLKNMGELGSSRSIKIEDWKGNFGFDGDGPSKIISIDIKDKE